MRRTGERSGRHRARSLARRLALGLAVLWTAGVGAADTAPDPIPIDSFASLPLIQQVSVSPSGRWLAFISQVGGRGVVLVRDRQSDQPPRAITRNDGGDEFRFRWCNWANDTRLLCGLRGVGADNGLLYPITRLVALNNDGSESKILIGKSYLPSGRAQFQDQILDWTPDDPNGVLIALDDNLDGYPDVFRLDVMSGKLRPHTPQRVPIRSFATDEKGEVRLGWGYRGNQISYFARLSGDKDWRELSKFPAFEGQGSLEPIAIVPGTDHAYAIGDYQGHDALWEIDLSDQQAPRRLAGHTQVDVDKPLLAADGHLLGIAYETDKPAVYYTDAEAKSIVGALNKVLPLTFNTIVARSRDNRVLVVNARSDVEAGAYYLLDRRGATPNLTLLGRAYPDLLPERLARQEPIHYPARDGTSIPGYLTRPRDWREGALPLIVMPHGGPIHRDSWGYDFLAQFLANRGYAVLQMNFRGSSGYGYAWFEAAHQDWGGLTYSDIVDGARWAIAQNIADAKRVAIVGWSFGGYAALLGAARDSDLFRCAAAIAGVSDLPALLLSSRSFSNRDIVRTQMGTDIDKLRDDSPRNHVDGIHIPILLVHGKNDDIVDFSQSEKMARALKKAEKPYTFIELENGDHNLWRPAERQQLLRELEQFLARNMAPASAPPPSP